MSLRLLKQDNLHRDLVDEIVERSFVEIRRRLDASLMNMSADEIRGYVRARATAPVHRHAQRLVAERQLKIGRVADLVDRALERISLVIVRDAAAPPIISLPAAAVPMRRAA